MPIKEHPAETIIQTYECDCGGHVELAKHVIRLKQPLLIPYVCIMCKKEHLLDKQYPRVVTRRKE